MDVLSTRPSSAALNERIKRNILAWSARIVVGDLKKYFATTNVGSDSELKKLY